MEKSSKYRKGSPQKKKVEDEMLKHYKWLADFDNDAKGRLLDSEVTNIHLLKLLTFLESNVSSEVSKLRTKRNRATKFLAQIRKRISMIKIGGYMIDPLFDRELFPTYGLLLKHIVDITLVSSKIEKFGAQQVASELYYFLKLVLHGDNEFVLDVILCSTLDEHANSIHQVGYHVFAFVVEDFRCFLDTHAGTMKYCAIASLLHASCSEGRVFVDKNLPPSMDMAFPKYLSNVLGITTVSRKANLKAAMLAIRVAPVKSLSRRRLVIVSRKEVSKASTAPSASSSQRSQSQSQDLESDAESTSSTVLNIPSTSFKREIPSSSAWFGQNSLSYDQIRQIRDPLPQILGDIGLFDTAGDNVVVTDDEDDEDSRKIQEESRVSSSSAITKKNNYSSAYSEPIEVKVEVNDEEDDEDLESHDYHDDELLSIPSNDGDRHLSDEDENHQGEDTEPLDDDTGSGGKEAGSLQIKTRLCLKRREEDEDVNMTEGYEEQVERHDSDKDDSSDLEILSVLSDKVEHSDNEGDNASTGSRDEAEAESGEDYVPNYDEDSDRDEMEIPLVPDTKSKSDDDQKNPDDVTSSEKAEPEAKDSAVVEDVVTPVNKEDKAESVKMDMDEPNGEDPADQSSPASFKSFKSENSSVIRGTARTCRISLSRDDVPAQGLKRNSAKISLTPSKRAKSSDDESDESTQEQQEQEQESGSENEKKEDNQIVPKAKTPTPTAKRGRKSATTRATPTPSQTKLNTAPANSQTMVATRRSTRQLAIASSSTPRKQDDDVESNTSLSSVSTRQGRRSTIKSTPTPRGRGRGRGRGKP